MLSMTELAHSLGVTSPANAYHANDIEMLLLASQYEVVF